MSGFSPIPTVLVNIVIVVLLEQAHQRRLEEVLFHLAVPKLTQLAGSQIETHVRVGHSILNLLLRHGVATNIDDRMKGIFLHDVPPGYRLATIQLTLKEHLDRSPSLWSHWSR
jgi:hypothetical protein